MTILRSAYFYPQSGAIGLHLTENGYARTRNVQLSDLPADMRQIAEGALSWLTGQLPAGMQTLTQVILERGADIPTAWSESEGEEPQPIAHSPSFFIAITGSGEKGEATISIQSTPGDTTNAVAALWEYLAQ